MKRSWLSVLAAGLVLAGLLPGRVGGEVPRRINYQGRLTDALGTPVNLETAVTFAFYTQSAGGGAVWSETQTVRVANGVFNVLLGSVNPIEPDYFLTHPQTYLGMKVGADSEIAPRREIAALAYAMRAEAGDTLSAAGRTAFLEVVYPVGAVFISALATNPADLLGFGTWDSFGPGRALAGYDGSDPDFNTGEKTGGAKTFNNAHYHNAADLRAAIGAVNSNPSTIGYRAVAAVGGVGFRYAIAPGQVSISHINHATPVYGYTDTQQSGSQSLLQPYNTIYIWKRTG